MSDFAIAVKAIIIQNEKVLLLKRRRDDVHNPDGWDIPGGRLDIGEDPFDGLKREAREEVSLDIQVVMPIHVNSFTRDDHQRVTRIIFLCELASQEIVLSEEHEEFKWSDLSDETSFPDWMKPAIDKIRRYSLHRKH